MEFFCEQFSGKMLERYFHDQLAESKKFTRLGSWWDRSGENEIDIIAENELEKTVKFIEVKRNAARIEMKALKDKAAAMLRATGEFKGYGISYEGLSLENIRKGANSTNVD